MVNSLSLYQNSSMQFQYLQDTIWTPLQGVNFFFLWSDSCIPFQTHFSILSPSNFTLCHVDHKFSHPSLFQMESLGLANVKERDRSMTWWLSVLKLDPGHSRGCFLQTPLRDCLMVTDVHSDISRHPSPASCYVLVPGAGCCHALVSHVQ